MIKRLAIVLMLFAAVAAGAFFLLDRRRDTVALTLLPRPDAVAASAWPLDKTWSWSFPVVAGSGEGFALKFRESSSTLAPGESPVVSYPEKPMTAAEANREFGTGFIHNLGATRGTATLQLLDLAHIGAVSTQPGQNLRALARLSVGGAAGDINGDPAILPAGHIVGTAPRDEGRWTNDQLFLMTFFSEGEGQLHRYDVFLERKSGAPH